MASGPNVDIDITASDHSSNVINVITNNVRVLNRVVNQNQQQNDRWSGSVGKMAKVALRGAKAVAKMAASVAAVASAAGPAASGLLALGKALAVAGRAGASLFTLAGFLPSLAGALALVIGTVKLAGPGLAKAFEPVTREFFDAKGEASKFTKKLQDMIAVGVKPLAREFVRLNMPAVKLGFEAVTRSLNLMVTGALRYINTAQGMAAIRVITEGTSKGMASLVPHTDRLVASIGNLVARLGDRAITSFFDMIGKILDRLAAWADNTTVDDVNKALKELSGYGKKLRDTWGAIKDIGKWLSENEGAIKRFSNVAGAGALALGVATGNVPAMVLGAVSLIINNWESLKPVFAASGGWVKDVVDSWRKSASLDAVVGSMKKAWQAGVAAFGEASKVLGPQWKEFVGQLKAAWEAWAPLIKMWWDGGGKAVFQAAGVAIIILVSHMLTMATAAADMAQLVMQAFKFMVGAVLNQLDMLINGAAKAFGWVPGIGPKLQAAAAAFNEFRDRVNASLAGIKDRNVTVTANYRTRGDVPAGVAVPGKVLGFGMTSWQRTAASFAGAQAGSSRTGGPAPVTARVTNTILLDGKPFREWTESMLTAAERRADWRRRTGPR